jgi:hypothetical protein
MKLLAAILLSLPLLAQAEICRDDHGRICRSQAMKRAFMRSHPCPATGLTRGACKGYVIDHIDPLCAGGADSPENMQWQTKAESLKKDRWERSICKGMAD